MADSDSQFDIESILDDDFASIIAKGNYSLPKANHLPFSAMSPSTAPNLKNKANGDIAAFKVIQSG